MGSHWPTQNLSKKYSPRNTSHFNTCPPKQLFKCLCMNFPKLTPATGPAVAVTWISISKPSLPSQWYLTTKRTSSELTPSIALLHTYSLITSHTSLSPETKQNDTIYKLKEQIRSNEQIIETEGKKNALIFIPQYSQRSFFLLVFWKAAYRNTDLIQISPMLKRISFDFVLPIKIDTWKSGLQNISFVY